ncbi:penicillin-binding protein activator LpoB [Aureivirga marina]|uniref:penicillin-binding protein activator LpoB n=1 Tax=Aureivirga marina TaxID=1182451 RepID=UPI0018CBE1C9|nr:penicillin-binding protein activator LpoB [Aureivirga marina]
MKKIILLASLSFIIVFSLESCSRKIQRVSPDQTIDISGRWNDSDSRMVSEDMIQQVLSGAWLDRYRTKFGKEPVVIVGLVRNKSHEHIDAETFIKDIEQSFIRSGRVRLVKGGAFREELRAERADQQNNASISTVKKFGKELGADFMLQGTINSIVDAHKKEKVVYYQINLELTNIETNETVWIGDKKIKKFIEN